MPARFQRLQDLADEELMARYVQDEEAAFELLLSRYRRPLFGYLFRYLGREDKAEDVFQEVFFEVIRARKRYRPESKFAAWIFRIARNRAVDRLRRDGFREMESLDGPINPGKDESLSRLNLIPDNQPSPEEAAGGRELEEALLAALEKLPPEQREVFWLKEKSEMTLAEIAELTGVSPNTVKSRLRYALEKIRSDLASRGFKP